MGGSGAPATTLPTETEGLAVTDVGDPAATYLLLRVERSVGATSMVVLDESTSGSSTQSDTGSETPCYAVELTSSLHAEGSLVVTSEMADGTFTTTFTAAAISGQYASNDPEEPQFTDGFTSLTGLPISMYYGPEGAFSGASPADGATATEGQEQWLISLEFPGYSLPSTPIGVGATWTAPLDYGAAAAFGTGTANYRLDAVNGDQFSVSVTMDVDLAAVQPDALTDSLTGLVAVRTTITGSLTTATQLSITTESTVDYQGSYSYCVDESFHRLYRRTYVETPAS